MKSTTYWVQAMIADGHSPQVVRVADPYRSEIETELGVPVAPAQVGEEHLVVLVDVAGTEWRATCST